MPNVEIRQYLFRYATNVKQLAIEFQAQDCLSDAKSIVCAKVHVQLCKFSVYVHEFFDDKNASHPQTHFGVSSMAGRCEREFVTAWPVAQPAHGKLVSWSQHYNRTDLSYSPTGTLHENSQKKIIGVIQKLQTDMREWLELVEVNDKRSHSKTESEAEKAISSFKPDGREANVLVAMKSLGVTSPVDRKSQKEIVKAAIGNENVNDNRRVFKKLKALQLIVSGKNGRGFYLSELGATVADLLNSNK